MIEIRRHGMGAVFMNQYVEPEIQAVCNDITARETAEQGLKESEPPIRDFAETATWPHPEIV